MPVSSNVPRKSESTTAKKADSPRSGKRLATTKAIPGIYRIRAHYYGGNRNRLSDATFVEVKVVVGKGKGKKVRYFHGLLTPGKKWHDLAEVHWSGTSQ